MEVATSFTVNQVEEHLSEDGEYEPDSSPSYHSLLFTIKNISDTIIWMGRSFSVCFVHLEVKDQKGHWVKVGKKISEMGICLAGEPHIYLKPGEIMISKLRCYKGTFLTDARLVFGYEGNQICSNIFRQSVDPHALHFP